MENKEQIEAAAEMLYLPLDKREAFIEGANWMQKRMYTEEEVIAIVEKSRETGLIAEYLIEQFKKE